MKTLELVAQRATVGREFIILLNRVIELAELVQAEGVVPTSDEGWAVMTEFLKGSGYTGDVQRSSTRLKALLESQSYNILVKLRMLVGVGRDEEADPDLYGEPSSDKVQKMIADLCQNERLPEQLGRGFFLVKQQGINIEANWV